MQLIGVEREHAVTEHGLGKHKKKLSLLWGFYKFDKQKV